MALDFCYKESKPCARWAERYFKDCLCNLKDEFSFGFGIVSLVCWGVAEIPQIITNFRTKSSHGVSLAFLMTWIAGDVFNLIGCLLEPATLPTQLYTALLYTASTVVLVAQSLYYDYFLQWKKQRRATHSCDEPGEEDKKEPFKSEPADVTTVPIPASSPRRDYYFTSARSLARSSTPPFRSYLRVARSGPSALALSDHSSSDDEETPPQPPSKKSATRPKPIPRSAGYAAFLAASVTLPRRGEGLMRSSYILVLQEGGSEHSAFGQWLGWIMAAIYMGGRVPQIWLNIKRGSVEGLNPLMFVFALVANLTYVLSIVVRTTDWDKIKANLPWLLDAAVCVMLDFFIISQYMYYRFIRGATEFDVEDSRGDYREVGKE